MGLMDLAREPAIRLRLGTGWRLGRSSDGASLAAWTPAGWELALTDHVARYEDANRRLAAGAPLAELRDSVAAAGGMHASIAYLVLLQEWCRLGLLEFPLVDGQDELAVLVPQWREYLPALTPETPPPEHRLHRFAYLRDDGGVWLLESPLCGVRVRLANLASLEEPLVRRALAAGAFLDGADSERGEPRQNALHQWEFHDLLFHVRQRCGWHRDPAGATFPFVGRISPIAAERPPWPGEAIELPRTADTRGDEPFGRLLERRRSEREYDETRPISLHALGALLDRCARIRSTESIAVADGHGGAVALESASRPYPSGGKSYELEIYPIVNRCDGLDPGAYHYDASGHRLVRIAGRTPDVEQLIADAGAATGGRTDPQVVLSIAARFGRVMWQYRTIAYALILRHTGVLYQTLYLAATELGLSPCALGSGDSALFARLTGLDPWVEGSVGEFILGGRRRGGDRDASLAPGG